MKKKLIASVLIIAAWHYVNAQDWIKLGEGLDRTVRSMYADSASGLLYVGGEFRHSGTLPLNNVGLWDGNKWDSLGQGSTGGMPGYSITKFKGRILACSDFFNSSSNTLAQWNGKKWVPYYFSANGTTETFEQKDSVLYLGGTFNLVGNIPSNYICSWNGESITPINLNVSWAYINALQFYHNNLYIGGNFEDSTLSDLCMYNGDSILPVGMGIPGHLYDEIYAMAVYNDELYVAGQLSKTGGDAGDNIMKWNGSAWSEVGGGTNSYIYCLAVHNNTLYAGGAFTQAGGYPADYLAQWDGNKWLPVGTEAISGPVLTIAFLNDEMYIGGGFEKIDTTIFDGIAKYNHILTDLRTIYSPNIISLFPNPTNSYLQLSNLPKQATILQYTIINTLGQIKQSNTLTPNNTLANINVSALPEGIYFIRLTDNKGFVYSTKFVKE